MTAEGSNGETPVRTRGATKQARREELLAVAAEVFSEKGYPSATLQDIASRLGMLKGSLYYYIDSKEDLLFEILRLAHEQGLVFVTDPLLSEGDPPARLTALIRRWMSGVSELPAVLQISENDVRYLSRKRRAEIALLRRRIGDVAENIIKLGIEEGYFDPSVDPYIVASTLFRVLNTTGSWHSPSRGIPVDRVTEWFVQLFLGGLAPAGDRRALDVVGAAHAETSPG